MQLALRVICTLPVSDHIDGESNGDVLVEPGPSTTDLASNMDTTTKCSDFSYLAVNKQVLVLQYNLYQSPKLM